MLSNDGRNLNREGVALTQKKKKLKKRGGEKE